MSKSVCVIILIFCLFHRSNHRLRQADRRADRGFTVVSCVCVTSITFAKRGPVPCSAKTLLSEKTSKKLQISEKVFIFAIDNVQRMSNDNIEQLSPQGDTRENEFGGLLAAASDFARGVLKTIHALAGTTACKGVQIARLKDWATANHCWIERNAYYDIFDAVPNNVLMGADGHLYFIDTIIFKSGTGGLDTYNSLSPRATSGYRRLTSSSSSTTPTASKD